MNRKQDIQKLIDRLNDPYDDDKNVIPSEKLKDRLNNPYGTPDVPGVEVSSNDECPTGQKPSDDPDKSEILETPQVSTPVAPQSSTNDDSSTDNKEHSEIKKQAKQIKLQLEKAPPPDFSKDPSMKKKSTNLISDLPNVMRDMFRGSKNAIYEDLLTSAFGDTIGNRLNEVRLNRGERKRENIEYNKGIDSRKKAMMAEYSGSQKSLQNVVNIEDDPFAQKFFEQKEQDRELAERQYTENKENAKETVEREKDTLQTLEKIEVNTRNFSEFSKKGDKQQSDDKSLFKTLSTIPGILSSLPKIISATMSKGYSALTSLFKGVGFDKLSTTGKISRVAGNVAAGGYLIDTLGGIPEQLTQQGAAETLGKAPEQLSMLDRIGVGLGSIATAGLTSPLGRTAEVMTGGKVTKKEVTQDLAKGFNKDIQRTGQIYQDARKEGSNVITSGLKAGMGLVTSSDTTLKDVNKMIGGAKQHVSNIVGSIGDMITPKQSSQPAKGVESIQGPKPDILDRISNMTGKTLDKLKTFGMGMLAAKGESNSDPGVVNEKNAAIDPGGYSYGAFQFSTKRGKLKEFLEWLKDNKPEYFTILQKAGGNEAALRGDRGFIDTWKSLAKSDPKGFTEAQVKFMQSNYDVMSKLTKGIKGLNLDDRSLGLKNYLYSLSVNRGGQGTANMMNRVFSGKDLSKTSDEDIVKTLAQDVKDRINVSHKSSPEKQRQAIAKRFGERERDEAIEIIQEEKKNPGLKSMVGDNSMIGKTANVVNMTKPTKSDKVSQNTNQTQVNVNTSSGAGSSQQPTIPSVRNSESSYRRINDKSFRG